MPGEWKGMDTYPHVRHRREQALQALFESEHPLSTKDIWKRIKGTAHYGTIYADMRTLSGSHTVAYADHQGLVNAPGYPVVWHSWSSDSGATVVWSLVPDYRSEMEANEAMFNELMKGMPE